MNFLLDCLVEDENDEICMFDFTSGHLQDKHSSDIKWVTFKKQGQMQSRFLLQWL